MHQTNAESFMGGYTPGRPGTVSAAKLLGITDPGNEMRTLDELVKAIGYEVWIVEGPDFTDVCLTPRSEMYDEVDTEEANAVKELLEIEGFEDAGASANEALWQSVAYRIGERGLAVLSQGTRLGLDAFHYPFERERLTILSFYMKPFPADFDGDPFTLMWPEDAAEEQGYELQSRGIAEAIHAAKQIIG